MRWTGPKVVLWPLQAHRGLYAYLVYTHTYTHMTKGYENEDRAEEMAQKVKVPATRSNHLGLIPGTHTVREPITMNCSLTYANAPWHAHPSTHTQINVIS